MLDGGAHYSYGLVSFINTPDRALGVKRGAARARRRTANAAVVTIALAVIPAAVRADAGPDTGRRLYLARCARCHGERGKPHAATLLGPTTILSRRGHVALGLGAQLPVPGRRPFDWRIGAELYCEYMEGAPCAW